MGYPEGHKAKTRERIIKAARKVWKSKGYDGASVDAVMKEANLTRGGFYAHFKSKEDLFTYALMENKIIEGLSRMEAAGVHDPDLQKQAVIDWYLDGYHRDNPDDGCPLTTFTQEAPRIGEKPRQVLGKMIARFGSWLSGETKEKNGLAVVSLMVGAITLSRAVGPGNVSDRILAEAKETARKLI